MTEQEMAEKERWAISFKAHHNCNGCPFVKHEVDVGIGIIRDCDHVCCMEVDDILKEMEGYCV